MSLFKGNFSQGGQTELHKFHMTKQVAVSTVKISFWVSLMSWMGLIFSKVTWHDLWFILMCGKAYVRIHFFNMLPSNLFSKSYLFSQHGRSFFTHDHNLLYHTTYTRHFFWVIEQIKSAGWMSLAIFVVMLISVTWFWQRKGKASNQVKILSGTPQVSLNALIKQIKKNPTSAYTLERIPIPKEMEYQHFMITGSTGTGKSNAIHQLLEQIRLQGDQAIILDSTGGIFQRFYQAETDHYFNPCDAHSKNWNMWKEGYDSAQAKEIAATLIPEAFTHDPFWSKAARDVFSESFRAYLLQSEPEMRSYQEFCELLISAPLPLLSTLLNKSRVAPLVDSKIEKTALSIRSTLSSQLDGFQYLENDPDGISFLDFGKTNTKDWVFFSCHVNQRAQVTNLFSVWMSLIIKGIMTRSENNASKTWIIIDELASLNKLPVLTTALSEIRKYGGCMVIGFQDLNQLEAIYGSPLTKTIINLASTKVVFRNGDSDTANRMSRMLGEYEKEEAVKSISFGAHEIRDGVSLNQQIRIQQSVRMTEILSLENLEAFVKFPGHLPVTKVKYAYKSYPTLNTISPSKEPLPMYTAPIHDEGEEEGGEIGEVQKASASSNVMPFPEKTEVNKDDFFDTVGEEQML